MKIGICLPYMKAGLTRQDYLDWFTRCLLYTSDAADECVNV